MPDKDGIEIIKPETAQFIKLDDVSVKLTTLTKVLVKQQEIMSEQREVMLKLLNVTLLNQENIKAIKQDLIEKTDEGEYLFENKTATTTATTYDFIGLFGFAVKGFIFKNDGNNTIEFGYMSNRLLLDVSDERLGTVLAGEELKISYNTRRINKIMLKTEAGISDYRIWILW